jgi:hypothetical protein
VDQVEAEEEHTIDRRLHFGPDLVASESDGAVVAKDEQGRVIATLLEGSEPRTEITMARGVEEPRLDGWTFPRDLTKVPSDTVTLRTRLATGLLIHGIALISNAPTRIAARGPSRVQRLVQRVRRAENSHFLVEIDGKGGSSELRVSQSETNLRVSSLG